jgi:hypothetical protein
MSFGTPASHRTHGEESGLAPRTLRGGFSRREGRRMSDNPMHAGYRPKVRLPRRPGELLFSFRDHKHRQMDCELVNHDQWGIEAMFLIDRELLISRRFDTRELAIQWAKQERPLIEKVD